MPRRHSRSGLHPWGRPPDAGPRGVPYEDAVAPRFDRRVRRGDGPSRHRRGGAVPEPIRKGDGPRRNDRGRNAGRRLPAGLRREHPHPKAIIAGDGPASSGPHVRHPGKRDSATSRATGPVATNRRPSGARETGRTPVRRDNGTGTVHHLERGEGPPPTDANRGIRASMPDTGRRTGKDRRKGSRGSPTSRRPAGR